MVKSSFFREKAVCLNKTLNQRFGANLKNPFFCRKFVTFLHFFSFLAKKMLKMTISTRVWGAQQPSAGQNIQHL